MISPVARITQKALMKPPLTSIVAPDLDDALERLGADFWSVRIDHGGSANGLREL
jgi:hypothetical protein